MMKHILQLILLLFCSIPALAGDNNVGTIVGSIDIGDKGDLSYTIPIETIPAASGVNPKVSLGFHSGLTRASGVAGWFIQPVQKVEQCFRHDQTKRLEAELTYCLNGQELILTKGDYGSPGSQYRNRIDNLDRITKEQNRFIVEKKNGDKEYYAESTIKRADGETLVWYLSRLEDRNGNYLSYQYASVGESQKFLKRISYGGNDEASLEHYRHVEIEYSEVDSLPKYRFGANQTTNVIPKKISVSSFDQTVWYYSLNWDKTDADVHILSSIEKCSSPSNCLPATKFTYEGVNSDPAFAPKSLGNMFTMQDFPWSSYHDLRLASDLNYDGYIDLIGIRSGQIHLSYGSAQGFSARKMFRHNGLRLWERTYPIQIADIDRDGFADLLVFDRNGVDFIRGKQNGFSETSVSSTVINGIPRNDAKRELDDFDHDGDLDIIALELDGTYLIPFEQQTGKFGAKQRVSGGLDRSRWQADWPIYFADMNGDGHKDFVGINRSDVLVALRTAEGYSSPKSWSQSPVLLYAGSGQFSHGLSDMNNDGLADFFVVNGRGLHVTLNNGSAFNTPILWNKHINASSFNISNSVITTADINNDGHTDIIASLLNKVHVLYGTGRVNSEAVPVQFTPGYSAVYPAQHPVFASDLDNDTVTDLLILHQRDVFAVKNRDQAILLTKVEDGLSNQINIDWDVGNQRKTVETEPVAFDKKRFQIFQNNFTTVRGLTTTGPSGYSEQLVYRYTNPLVSKKESYRFVGFFKKIEQAISKNLTHVTEYAHLIDNLEILSPKRKQTFATWQGNQVLVNQIDHEWKVRDLGGYFQLLTPSVFELSYDETGTELSRKQTAKQFDEFLNLIRSDIEVKDKYGPYRIETVNNFANDTDKWVGNRLMDAQVTYRRGSQSETKRSAFTYDEKGILRSEITEPGTPYEKKVVYQRNTLGLPIRVETKIIDASNLPKDSFTATFEYDRYGFTKTERNDLGHTTITETNKIFGRPQKVTDPNGLWLESELGPWGEVRQITHKDGREELTEEFWCKQDCPSGAAYYVKNKQAGEADSVAYYDSQSRPVRESVIGFDGRWVHSDTTYTEAGLVKTASNPFFEGDEQSVFTARSYDDLQRLTKLTKPDGSIIRMQYDGLDRIEIDAEGRKKTHLLNALGEKLAIAFEDGSRIKFSYTASGKLETTEDSKGNSTTLEYDVLGRRTKITDPSTGVTQTFYNGLGLVYQTVANDGTIAENHFDNLGRTQKNIRQKAGNRESIQTEWDTQEYGIGLPAKQVKGTYQEAFTYDQFSRLSSAAYTLNNESFTYTYSYNEHSKLKQQTYPSGYAIAYGYNSNGYLQSITDVDSGKKLVTHDSSSYPGEITETSYGNGIKTTSEFNRLNGRLETLSTPTHPSVLDLGYVYDRVGNVTQKHLRHLGLSETYAYDARYQLVKVTDETGIETVSYDALGNIESINNPGYSAEYKYGDTCGNTGLSGYQLCQIIRQEQGNPVNIVKKYTYDKSGRVIDDGARKITYGLNGKPIHFTSAAAEISFEYGPENQRIIRTDRNGSKVSKILYVGDSFEVLTSDDRKILRHYVDGYLHVDIEEGQKKETYLHRDLLGSVVSLTDADGNLIQTQNFTVWGERKNQDVASDLTLLDQNSLRGYTNHEMLDSIGLIHMNGRVYDPAAWRFISPDPFIQDISESVSFNRYAYAWNNPASGTDPSGYFFKDIAKAGERFGDWISDSNNQRQLIVTAAVIVASIYVPAIAANYGQFAAYAYVGTVNYAGTYYATNGNHDASMRSAATSMAFYGVGSAFDSDGLQGSLGYKEGNPGAAYGVSKAAAHGMVGGASSVASGGKFEHGFLSAGVSSAVSTYGGYEAIGATDNPSGVADYAWNAGAAAVVGGTISQISGGSFEEGATTAAYGRLFNDLSHPAQPDFSCDADCMERSYSQAIHEDDTLEMATPGGPVKAAIKKAGKTGVTRSVKELANKLRDIVGRNTVKIKTPSKHILYDLRGAPHKGVPTPHIQHKYPNTKNGVTHWNKDRKFARPMNHQDIRTLRSYLERNQ